jgi:ribonuclease D
MPYIYVETDSLVGELVSRLREAKRVAVAIEADSLHHYFEKVCLIQTAVKEQNYIVDTLAGLDLSHFFGALAENSLIFHGGDYDLRMLRMSFGFRPKREVFDTMLAAQLLGYEKIGLAALVERFFDVRLVKRGQKWDWSARPLSAGQLEYAGDDTRYLNRLAELLECELTKLGRCQWHKENCEWLVRATDRGKKPGDADNAWRIKGCKDLGGRQLALVRGIWQWRQDQAMKADIPPFKIMGNHLILDIARWADLCGKSSLAGGPRLPRNYGAERRNSLERVIEKALTMRKEDWPEQRRRQYSKRCRPEVQLIIKKLRSECLRLSKELDIDAGVLAPVAALKAIASERARSTRQIMKCAGLLRWQAELLEPGVKAILKAGAGRRPE